MLSLLRKATGSVSALLLILLRLEARGRVVVGSRARFRSAWTTYVASTGHLIVGEGATVERGAILVVAGSLTIGERAYVASGVTLGCEQAVSIGARSAIATNVVILDTNKRYEDPAAPLVEQGTRTKPVVIGEDCWIGANAVVLPGVELGPHCVVGAGAVVTRSFPSGSVILGVPGRNRGRKAAPAATGQS